MVAYPHIRLRHIGLNAAIPPVGGVAAAVIVALVFAFLPQDMLEDWTWNSGVAALVPVAQPPLGVTARAILALGFGVIAAAVVWASLYLLFGPGGFLAPRAPAGDGVPVLRRADSHPDAPARRPISAAADLGDPVLPPVPPLVRDLPDDLDQPLAAYDPHAIRPAPREPVRPVASLTAKPAMEAKPPVEPPPVSTSTPPAPAAPPPVPAMPLRIEPRMPIEAPVRTPTVTIDPPNVTATPSVPLRIEHEPRPESKPSAPHTPLPVPSTPAAGAPSPATVTDDSPPSIEMLLARLERGARRRPDAPRPSIDEALGTLRGIDR